MPLPTSPLATSTVDVAGGKVTFRSLSRAEVVSLAAYGEDTASAETFMLSRACDIPEDEAAAWRQAVDAPTAGKLLAAIAKLSGLKSGEA